MVRCNYTLLTQIIIIILLLYILNININALETYWVSEFGTFAFDKFNHVKTVIPFDFVTLSWMDGLLSLYLFNNSVIIHYFRLALKNRTQLLPASYRKLIGLTAISTRKYKRSCKPGVCRWTPYRWAARDWIWSTTVLQRNYCNII